MSALNGRPQLAMVDQQAHVALDQRSDDELMLLVRGGKSLAFDTLVKRHQARVLRIIARYLSDHSLTQDVAQCAFLELFRSCERYQARGKFTAYLCRIVINQCRMNARSRRTTIQFVLTESVASLSESEVLERVGDRDLQLALSKLSDKLRSVVVLRYVGDLELIEIADTLNLPLGTVKRRLFDAMAKLRQLMEAM